MSANLPPWGTQRIDEMSDDEKVAAMLADSSAYMTQARAEELPKARAFVERRLAERSQRRREERRKLPWWRRVLVSLREGPP